MKEELTASRVFSAMSVFDLLREQMWMVFGMTPRIVQAKVSLDRVSEFLRMACQFYSQPPKKD